MPGGRSDQREAEDVWRDTIAPPPEPGNGNKEQTVETAEGLSQENLRRLIKWGGGSDESSVESGAVLFPFPVGEGAEGLGDSSSVLPQRFSRTIPLETLIEEIKKRLGLPIENKLVEEFSFEEIGLPKTIPEKKTIPTENNSDELKKWIPLFEGGKRTPENFQKALEKVQERKSCCGNGKTVMQTDCGVTQVVPHHCDLPLFCPKCSSFWRDEVITQVKALATYAESKEYRLVFLTLTLKERDAEGLDKWGEVFGKFLDSRVPVAWNELLEKELVENKHLTDEQKALQRCLAKLLDGWIAEWYAKNGLDKHGKKRYLKVRNLIPAGLRVLQTSLGEEDHLHPHVHAITALFAPIPQVLLSVLWEKHTGSKVVHLKLLDVEKEGPDKVASYVARYVGRNSKKLKKGEKPLTDELRLCLDAYLTGRQRRKWFGVQWEEASALVKDSERGSDYVCPFCKETGCGRSYFGKVAERSGVKIQVGNTFRVWIKDRYHTYEILDENGRCDVLAETS